MQPKGALKRTDVGKPQARELLPRRLLARCYRQAAVRKRNNLAANISSR